MWAPRLLSFILWCCLHPSNVEGIQGADILNEVHKTLMEFPLADQAAALIASSVEEEGGPNQNISLGSLIRAALKGKEAGGSTQQIMSNAINKGGQGKNKELAQVFQNLEKSLKETPQTETSKSRLRREKVRPTERDVTVQRSADTSIEGKRGHVPQKRSDPLQKSIRRESHPDSSDNSSTSGGGHYSSSSGGVSSYSSSHSGGGGDSSKGSGSRSSPSGAGGSASSGSDKGLSSTTKEETPHSSSSPTQPTYPVAREPPVVAAAAAAAARKGKVESKTSLTFTLCLLASIAVVLIIIACIIVVFMK